MDGSESTGMLRNHFALLVTWMTPELASDLIGPRWAKLGNRVGSAPPAPLRVSVYAGVSLEDVPVKIGLANCVCDTLWAWCSEPARTSNRPEHEID